MPLGENTFWTMPSRVKGRSSPARGYKFGCVCSYIDGHEDAGVMIIHIRTNTPKFVVPLAGDDRPLTLLERGCANLVVGLELAGFLGRGLRIRPPPYRGQTPRNWENRVLGSNKLSLSSAPEKGTLSEKSPSCL